MTTKSRSGNSQIIAIAIGAVVLRILGIVVRSSEIEQHAFEYGRIAQNIISGAGFSFNFYGNHPNTITAWMAPLYPYILAAYYQLAGQNLIGMAIIQAILCGIVCWALGIVGKTISGRSVGIYAAMIFAIHPEMVFLPQKFVAVPWLLLWFAFFLICAVKYIEQGKRRYIVIAGIMAGLATLTKESAFLYPL